MQPVPAVEVEARLSGAGKNKPPMPGIKNKRDGSSSGGRLEPQVWLGQLHPGMDAG